jgi:hypothetical protein
MAYNQILLDSCSYIRLIGTIFPLLGIPFGERKYALYIHKDFSRDFDRSSRLTTKFSWLNEDRYSIERKNKTISITPKENFEIDNTMDYLYDFKIENSLDLSNVDLKCIATALVKGIELVTDDNQMLKTAKEYSIKSYRTVEVVKLMLENQFINMDQVESIYLFLSVNNDLPPSFRKGYLDLFGHTPPS